MAYVIWNVWRNGIIWFDWNHRTTHMHARWTYLFSHVYICLNAVNQRSMYTIIQDNDTELVYISTSYKCGPMGDGPLSFPRKGTRNWNKLGKSPPSIKAAIGYALGICHDNYRNLKPGHSAYEYPWSKQIFMVRVSVSKMAMSVHNEWCNFKKKFFSAN